MVEQLESRAMLATITVTTLGPVSPNDGQISFGEALLAANANESIDGSAAGEAEPTIDRIVFASGLSGNVRIFAPINESVVIEGPGASQLSVGFLGNDGVPGFLIHSTANDVTIRGLTITGSTTTSISGGGISSNSPGVLTIENCVIKNNGSELADGGGIYMSAGHLRLINSTVTNNSAGGSGGGIWVGGTATITNSEVSENTASGGGGGGILAMDATTIVNSTISGNSTTNATGNGGGIVAVDTLTIASSTVTQNSALGHGGGIYALDFLDATTTIVAQNTATSLGQDIFEEANAQATYRGNLIGIVEGTSLNPSVILPIPDNNVLGTAASPRDPMMLPLANNGGPTRTHALLPNSPAVDRDGAPLLFPDLLDEDNDGNDNEPIPFDQRGVGFERVQFGKLDIGAYEIQPLTNVPSLMFVTTADDELDPDPLANLNDLSLREALELSFRGEGTETIRFDPTVFATPKTIQLVLGDLKILDAVKIDAPIVAATGAHIVTINGSNSVFQPAMTVNLSNASANDSVSLKNLSITGVNSTGVPGAVVSNMQGTLTIENSTISGNTTGGGALYARNGKLDVVRSTISGNVAGGIRTDYATLTVTNSTISGNTPYVGTGGIDIKSGNATITNSTIVNNVSSDAAGGIQFDELQYTIKIHNSIVSGNTSSTSSPDLKVSTNPLATEVRFSLIGDRAGTLLTESQTPDPVTGNIVGDAAHGGRINARLAPLAGNGGTTRTHSLLAASPAINTGSTALAVNESGQALTTDQRGSGFPRLIGSRVEMGAVEFRVTTFSGISILSTGPNGVTDPPDLSSGPQPTSWSLQRSSMPIVTLSFDAPITKPSANDFVLTNLGLNASNGSVTTGAEAEQAAVIVPMLDEQITLSTDGMTVSLAFPSLDDGVYQLDLLPAITGGDMVRIQGNAENKFYVLHGDWNGSGSVTIQDFATFAYWFGESQPPAPGYVDLNSSGGVNLFDFARFAENFGKSITFPTVLSTVAVNGEASVTSVDALVVVDAQESKALALATVLRSELAAPHDEVVALVAVPEAHSVCFVPADNSTKVDVVLSETIDWVNDQDPEDTEPAELKPAEYYWTLNSSKTDR